MEKCELIVSWRHYACGEIVFEDDFSERDHSIPYYDDYSDHSGTLSEYEEFIKEHAF